jgi:hypothetical protein
MVMIKELFALLLAVTLIIPHVDPAFGTDGDVAAGADGTSPMTPPSF